MWTFNGYCLYIFVILIFGNLQGVCVVLADTVMVLKAGSSLDLPLKYPVESGLLVQWAFNKSAFAEYSADQNYTFLDSQFTGRLKGDDDKVGVTVQDLRPQDSGTFVVTANSINTQYPTQIFKVYIQSPITAVQIEKSQTWLTSTNSCEVVVKCAAPGAERVSYSWSGYQIASEAQLQFSLSPAEGAVTLNCTAANSISYGSATETLSCAIQQYVWIAVAGGALLLLLILVVALICCWRSRKNSSTLEVGNTLYADVNAGPTAHKDKRSDSFVNGMTVYETVDDLRVNPEMTIYAKVTLPQQTKVSATSSSPYQKVL
ncbi:SLAM family member 8-like isoform X2 [Neoarius graeffei]|uniref:SLAM family member 8-like isoform X2 n=1 Tax=Neoarius graeffei TaxID=443677 RepID=UPI00298CFB8A|nr:SLAM family member 8-like isoform X2 [Neoarius graeffei]